MINLSLIEFIFSTIIFIFAYMITHTISGSLQAYCTYLLGDPTAREEGYLSLNPLVHLDPFGIFALLFFGIGWFQTVPIDPSYFRGQWGSLKLGVAFFAEAFISIILAIISLFLCVCSFSSALRIRDLIGLVFSYRPIAAIFSSSGAHFNMASLFAAFHSPLSIVIAYLLIAIVYLNILIATVSIIYNGFRYMLAIGAEKSYSYMEYADYFTFFGPILVLFLFIDPLINYFMRVTEWAAYHMAFVCGV